MNKTEFWELVINKFGEHMKEQGYSEEYIKVQMRNLRKLLRELGDLSNVDENMIRQKYMHYSKGYRKLLRIALRSLKRWLKTETRLTYPPPLKGKGLLNQHGNNRQD